MPKIHFIGMPLDLYRYKTFLDTLIDRKNEWGVSLNYNSFHYSAKKRNFLLRKFSSLIWIIQSIYLIWSADYIYCPPMVIGNNPTSRRLMKICSKLKKKVIFDFYISLYDTFVLDRKSVEPNSKEASVLSYLDEWGHTRFISIYLNRCEAKRYRSLNNLELFHNIRIIPLSISQRPFALLKYYRKRVDERRFNMIWWGTYIPLHGIEHIIDAVKIIKEKQTNIHLYILGNNPDLSIKYKEEVARNEGLSEYITISDEMTFSNGKLLPFLIENCDLAFGAFGDSEKARSVILNKSIEAVAMKIPVLTQYSEAFEEYFNPENTIFYCNNTAEDIADKILYIKSLNYNSVEKRIDSAFKVYENYFSIDASKRFFNQLLDELKCL